MPRLAKGDLALDAPALRNENCLTSVVVRSIVLASFDISIRVAHVAS